MSDLGCFFMEAWRAYTDHHRGKDASYDPRLSTEEHCRSFLQLLQDNDNDVQTALKASHIRVDWHHAARKLNTGNSAATRYGQRR